MQARQVGAKLRRQLRPALGAGASAEQATGGDTRHVLHQEEHPPMHAHIAAQPQRARYFHTGLMNHLQHRELLFAVKAGG